MHKAREASLKIATEKQTMQGLSPCYTPEASAKLGDNLVHKFKCEESHEADAQANMQDSHEAKRQSYAHIVHQA